MSASFITAINPSVNVHASQSYADFDSLRSGMTYRFITSDWVLPDGEVLKGRTLDRGFVRFTHSDGLAFLLLSLPNGDRELIACDTVEAIQTISLKPARRNY
jgi:hypothetical protein